MSFLSSLFGGSGDRQRLAPLYSEVVATARAPFWYLDGGVPDNIDGRFDMLTAILSLVLLRLEAEGERARQESVWLTECFIDDMEGSVREFGTGDLMVGKRVGELVGALGGRIGAFRTASGRPDEWQAAVRRNIFHEAPPAGADPVLVAERLRLFSERLQRLHGDEILAGKVPSP